MNASQSPNNSDAPQFPLGALNGSFSGNGPSFLGGFGAPALFAALIGLGKNTETNNANNPVGKGLLAGLGPSISQVAKDPVGMGLPTLLGAPFLTPFTASKQSQQTPAEWSSIFPFGL